MTAQQPLRHIGLCLVSNPVYHSATSDAAEALLVSNNNPLTS
jgi:hypothetical protein